MIARLNCIWTSKNIPAMQSFPLINITTVFLYNKTNHTHKFPQFTPAWNSTRFGQLLCPSSGVYSLYTRHWYMSYRYEDSFRAGPGWSCSKAVFKPVWHIPVPSVLWINSWWWAEELPEICRVSCRSKFGKFVHLVCFIIKKSLPYFPGHCTYPTLNNQYMKFLQFILTYVTRICIQF